MKTYFFAWILLAALLEAGCSPSGRLRDTTVNSPDKRQKDYSRYNSIYDIIRTEFNTLKVVGTEVHNIKTNSIYLSQQVLYVVDGMTVSDISDLSPMDIADIRFLDGPAASIYGMRGGNGVLEITLRKK